MVDRQSILALQYWLCAGAPPPADLPAVLAATVERLVAAGVPVSRFALFVFTLHPTVGGRRYLWTPERGVTTTEASHAFFRSQDFQRSPVSHIYQQGKALRRRLDGSHPADEFAGFFDELAATGVTDWYGQPLIHTAGEVNSCTWATAAPEGFADEALTALDLICPAFARIVEIHLLKLNTEALLSTFVGRDAGGRVLDGRIRRGDHDRVPAAILFADLAGFTRFSNRHSPAEVLDRLNRFFDALDRPIAAEGGEILKFLGDGLLAIFPVGSRHADAPAAARAALAALAAARHADPPAPPFRAALHAGEVFWGNIGSDTRLDFTAIGPAVNLGARLLEEASRRDAEALASEAFAALVPGALAPAGRAALKGFEGEAAVFAVA